MNKGILLSLGLNLLLALGIAYHHTSMYIGSKSATSKTNSGNEKTYRVAITMPLSHPSLDQIKNGFMETISNMCPGKVVCDVYDGNANRTLMRAQIEEILQGDYNLVFPIGSGCTQLAKEVTAKKKSFLPIVFGAVSDPVGLKVIESEASSGNNLTGVIDNVAHERQVDAYHFLKPDMKNVLMVYDAAGPGLEESIVELKELFAAKGVSVSPAPIYQTNELYQKVAPLITGVDSVLVLKDSTVVAGIDVLVKLCNRYGVTLMTSDLDSVDKGAAMGFGVYEYDMGIEGAKKAYQVLVEGKKPTTVPSTIADNFHIKVNKRTMAMQGLRITQGLMFCLSEGEVITSKI